MDSVTHHYREAAISSPIPPASSHPAFSPTPSDLLARLNFLFPLPSTADTPGESSSTSTAPRIQTHLLHLAQLGWIGPHVDNKESMGDVLVGVCLGGERVLRLERAGLEGEDKRTDGRVDVLLESGTVYVQRCDTGSVIVCLQFSLLTNFTLSVYSVAKFATTLSTQSFHRLNRLTIRRTTRRHGRLLPGSACRLSCATCLHQRLLCVSHTVKTRSQQRTSFRNRRSRLILFSAVPVGFVVQHHDRPALTRLLQPARRVASARARPPLGRRRTLPHPAAQAGRARSARGRAGARPGRRAVLCRAFQG